MSSRNLDSDLPHPIWDVIVIGTGMGGGTLGYALARKGYKVLFLERGENTSGANHGIRGIFPEDLNESQPDLARAGRYKDYLVDITDIQKPKKFIPVMGAGVGGSSALYGMIMERFNLDAMSWDLKNKDMNPYYQQAELLYRVKKGDDLPPLSPPNVELYNHFLSMGISPRKSPMACDFVDQCKTCQTFLCSRNCKADAARCCVLPACRDHGATLIENCAVSHLEETDGRFTTVFATQQNRHVTFSGKTVVLAAGALNSPAILLRSRSPAFPKGIGNHSDSVGRYLMRHYVDLYGVKTKTRPKKTDIIKQMSCENLKDAESNIPLGSFQSFGLLPPSSLLVQEMKEQIQYAAGSMASTLFSATIPLLRKILDYKLQNLVLMASITEDQACRDNRLKISDDKDDHTLYFQYAINKDDQRKIELMRAKAKSILAPYNYLFLKNAENNLRTAHVCGTCRMGSDPENSVVDKNNKVHGTQNLYVTDSSFFPTSGDMNPSLTIAANALRVADHIDDQIKSGANR